MSRDQHERIASTNWLAGKNRGLSRVFQIRGAVDTAQRKNGRKASELRELLSRNYNLTSVTKRLLFKSDLVNLIGSGRAQYSTTDKPQGTTERDIRTQLQGLFHSKSRFDAKVTVFATADDVPAELRDQAAVDASVDAEDVMWEGVQGFVTNGKVYLIAENIAPGKEPIIIGDRPRFSNILSVV